MRLADTLRLARYDLSETRLSSAAVVAVVAIGVVLLIILLAVRAGVRELLDRATADPSMGAVEIVFRGSDGGGREDELTASEIDRLERDPRVVSALPIDAVAAVVRDASMRPIDVRLRTTAPGDRDLPLARRIPPGREVGSGLDCVVKSSLIEEWQGCYDLDVDTLATFVGADLPVIFVRRGPEVAGEPTIERYSGALRIAAVIPIEAVGDDRYDIFASIDTVAAIQAWKSGERASFPDAGRGAPRGDARYGSVSGLPATYLRARLHVRRPSYLRGVVADLRAAYASRGFEVQSQLARVERYLQLDSFARIACGFVVLATLLASAGSTFSTLLGMVTRRRVDIGVMQALGLSSHGVARIYITESLILTGLGGALGVLGGLVLLAPADAFIRATLSTGDDRFLTLDVASVAGALLTAILVGFIGAAFPAYRAARVDPVAVLAGRGG